MLQAFWPTIYVLHKHTDNLLVHELGKDGMSLPSYFHCLQGSAASSLPVSPLKVPQLGEGEPN